jgi:hypothetical protein
MLKLPSRSLTQMPIAALLIAIPLIADTQASLAVQLDLVKNPQQQGCYPEIQKNFTQELIGLCSKGVSLTETGKFKASFSNFGTTNRRQMKSESPSTIFFNTSDSQFLNGTKNQGWWSTTIPNMNINDNYFVGAVETNILRNFFTFDLSPLNQNVVGATLELTRFMSSGDPEETIGFFDVSTDAVTLNNNTGTSASIFNDLGTGKSYGEFDVPPSGSVTDVFSFMLNANAIADINAARGGFFSIGGSLLSINRLGMYNEFFFASTKMTGIQRLILNTAPPQPVPEAMSGWELLAFVVLVASSARKHPKTMR